MSIGRALAILGAGATGWMQGDEEVRKRKRQDEDDAWRKEQRDRTRKDWADADAERDALKTAAAPVAAKPELAPEQAGPQTWGVDGRTIADPAAVDPAVAAANAPPAVQNRMAAAVAGLNPERAVKMRADAQQGELTGMQLKAAQREQDRIEKTQEIVGHLAARGPDAIPDVYSRYNDGRKATVTKNADGSFSVISTKEDGSDPQTAPFRDMPDFIARSMARFDPDRYMTHAESVRRAAADKEKADKDRDVHIEANRLTGVRDKNTADHQKAMEKAAMTSAQAHATTAGAQAAIAKAKADSLEDKMAPADLAEYRSLAKVIETSSTAMANAQAKGEWNPEHPGTKELLKSVNVTSGKLEALLARVRGGSATADPLGLLKPKPGATPVPAAGQRTERAAAPAKAASAPAAPASAPGPMQRVASAPADPALAGVMQQAQAQIAQLNEPVRAARAALKAAAAAGRNDQVPALAQSLQQAVDARDRMAAGRLGNAAPAFLATLPE